MYPSENVDFHSGEDNDRTIDSLPDQWEQKKGAKPGTKIVLHVHIKHSTKTKIAASFQTVCVCTEALNFFAKYFNDEENFFVDFIARQKVNFYRAYKKGKPRKYIEAIKQHRIQRVQSGFLKSQTSRGPIFSLRIYYA